VDPWLKPEELDRVLTAQDDLPHEPGSETGWREHWWTSFYDHDNQLFGKIWMGAVPNSRTGFAFCSVFRGSEQLFFVPATVGPLTFTCVEPFRKWRVQLSAGDAKLDLEWESEAPVYDWRWGRATLSRRTEQPGRISGCVTYRGERLTVNGMAMRDRSWGLRRQGIEMVEAYSTWALFSPEHYQGAGIIRTREKDFLFGYRITPDDAQLLEQLTVNRVRSYPGGPPLTLKLDGRFGADHTWSATTRLRNVLDQKTLVEFDGEERVDVRFSRQHCYWTQGGQTITAQLDYNESDRPGDRSGESITGNDGMFLWG
jgi:hypothetical protein